VIYSCNTLTLQLDSVSFIDICKYAIIIVIRNTSVVYKNYSKILIRYSKQILQKVHIRSNKRQARQLRRMTSLNRDRDLIASYAAVLSISFFIALFSCNLANGQQEDDTTSAPAIGGSISIPTPTPLPPLTPLSPPTPPSSDNIAQKQEQIIGSGSLVPSPSLPIEEDPADGQRFQPQEELTSEIQLTAEQEQKQQQLTLDEILKDPTSQAAELLEEEKEGTELEIKQRLDEIEGDEDGDREGSQRGGVREEQNNREEDNANSDTIVDEGEAPLDLQLPIPFP
jgi:hypothetical protein